MTEVGDKAPDIEGLEVSGGDLEKFKLSDHIGDGPVILAFFPAAFSPPCTNELISLQDKIEDFRAEGAKVIGVSVDNPFALNAFKEDEGFDFRLVSDNKAQAAENYGIKADVEDIDLHNVANRSVFVINDEGEVTYRWEAEDNLDEKCMDEILEVLRHIRENY